ncbi:MAG TPA: metallophosphoesterase family protein [Tepidisphaeraceae bacterium]|jgi:serine/threonine protein phosphatase 1|nr:metallophosphoesterase family protein [Tepidisphaeraceae bacterium]
MTPPPRTLVIGDVHGCLRQLDALLFSIAPTADDHLVFLGDLIDRGPDSAGVMKTVLRLPVSHRVTVIKGNHEQMMLDARESHDKFSDWLRNGGDATLKSYGGVRGTLRDVPSEHWKFLETALVDYLETDTHLFVHANAYPDMAMDEQPDYMLRWERCDRILPHVSGKTIVCGHTPQKSGRAMNRGYAICIDTHACGGKFLTCLDAGTGKVWQADANGKVQRAHISDFGEQ